MIYLIEPYIKRLNAHITTRSNKEKLMLTLDGQCIFFQDILEDKKYESAKMALISALRQSDKKRASEFENALYKAFIFFLQQTSQLIFVFNFDYTRIADIQIASSYYIYCVSALALFSGRTHITALLNQAKNLDPKSVIPEFTLSTLYLSVLISKKYDQLSAQTGQNLAICCFFLAYMYAGFALGIHHLKTGLSEAVRIFQSWDNINLEKLLQSPAVIEKLRAVISAQTQSTNHVVPQMR